MDNRNRWKLCGGTFFILISNARKQMPSKGEMYTGKKSGITEPETLMSLARIVTPDIEEPTSLENKSMRDGTSDFKACRGWGWRQFLLGDMAAKKSFDERMKNDYQGCLAQMTEFTNKYLDLRTDTHKDVFLVKALLVDRKSISYTNWWFKIFHLVLPMVDDRCLIDFIEIFVDTIN